MSDREITMSVNFVLKLYNNIDPTHSNEMMVLCDQDIFIFVSGLDNASLILLGRLRYIEKDRRLAFWYSCWGMSIRKYHCLMVQVVNSNGYDGNSSFCADFYDNSGFIIMNYLLFGLFKCLWLFRLLHRSLDLTSLTGFVLDRNSSFFCLILNLNDIARK